MADLSYGEQAARNAAALALAHLNDPDEHFPYKHDVVIDLLDRQPPMGPGSPGGLDGADDTSRTIDDYMSRGVADASRDYIDAQAEYLANRDEDTKANLDAARDRLVAARLDHRQNRGDGFTIGAAARKAG